MELSTRFSQNMELKTKQAANDLGISFSEYVRRALEEANHVCT